jgi:hypothetical protein
MTDKKKPHISAGLGVGAGVGYSVRPIKSKPAIIITQAT